jgi:hypothetical protein
MFGSGPNLSVLLGQPTSWWNWNYRIVRDDQTVAELDRRWFKEDGTLQIQNETYRIARQSTFSGAWELSQDGMVLVSATKPSALRRAFELRVGDVTYALEARSAWSRAFDLKHGQTVVGRFEPTGWLSRKMRIQLPANLSLAVQIFATWLVILLWRRAAQSS